MGSQNATDAISKINLFPTDANTVVFLSVLLVLRASLACFFVPCLSGRIAPGKCSILELPCVSSNGGIGYRRRVQPRVAGSRACVQIGRRATKKKKKNWPVGFRNLSRKASRCRSSALLMKQTAMVQRCSGTTVCRNKSACVYGGWNPAVCAEL